MSYESEEQEYQVTGAKLGKVAAIGLGGLGLSIGVIPAAIIGSIGGLAAYGVKEMIDEHNRTKKEK